jgi:predicted metalloprotease
VKTKLLTLALALAVVPTLVACGNNNNDKSAKGKKAAVISASSQVPRYAGLKSATKKPTLATLGQFKQLPAPAAGTPVPSVVGSDLPLDQFLDTVGNDAATYWQQVFNNSGVQWARTTQVIVQDPVDSACGKVNSDSPAQYCGADSSVYLPLGFFRDKVNPIGDAASVTMVGIMYGYRALDQLGAFDAVKAGKLKPADVQLQAVCLAGSWLATVAKRNLLQSGDTDEALALAKATASDPGTTGTDQQRQAALATGFKQGSAACQKLGAS